MLKNTKIARCMGSDISGLAGLREVEVDVGEARRHFRKAADRLDEMKALLLMGKYELASMASYQSMFHATTGALRSIGLESLNEECAIEAFKVFFTQTEPIEEKYRKYRKLAKRLPKKYADSLETVKTQKDAILLKSAELRDSEAGKLAEAAEGFVAKVVFDVSDHMPVSKVK